MDRLDCWIFDAAYSIIDRWRRVSGVTIWESVGSLHDGKIAVDVASKRVR
jgi:hypothetical protein